MSTEQNAVTAEPGNGPAAIRARVGDSAIDKVTRLFSAGLADIFTETLQNSRRGGANRVAATIEQDADITRVIQLTLRRSIPKARASSASCAPRPGRNP